MKKLRTYAQAKRKPSPKPPKRVKRRSKTKGCRNSDPKKLAWLRTLPCMLGTRSWNCVDATEVHHDRKLGARATAKKTIPLCGRHHRWGGTSIEKLGRRGFEACFGVTMDVETARYESLWQAHQARGGA